MGVTDKAISLKNAWVGLADCRACSLRQSVLFAGLTEREFETLHTPVLQRTLAPGDALFHAGDPASEMYTLRTGLVKLVRVAADGAQRIVRLLRPTDVAGLEGLTRKTHRHDAIALRPTEVCRFPVALVQDIAKTNAALFADLMARWQRAVDEAEIGVAEFSTGSARQRVARLALRLVDEAADAPVCELFSREDMGAVLGVTTETASRAVAELKRDGLLVERRANSYVCDVARLNAIADAS